MLTFHMIKICIFLKMLQMAILRFAMKLFIYYGYIILQLSHCVLYCILLSTHVVDAKKGIRSLKKSAPILFINTPGEGML